MEQQTSTTADAAALEGFANIFSNDLHVGTQDRIKERIVVIQFERQSTT